MKITIVGAFLIVVAVAAGILLLLAQQESQELPLRTGVNRDSQPDESLQYGMASEAD